MSFGAKIQNAIFPMTPMTYQIQNWSCQSFGEKLILLHFYKSTFVATILRNLTTMVYRYARQKGWQKLLAEFLVHTQFDTRVPWKFVWICWYARPSTPLSLKGLSAASLTTVTNVTMPNNNVINTAITLTYFSDEAEELVHTSPSNISLLIESFL